MPSTRFEITTFFVGLLAVVALIALDVRHWRHDHAAEAGRAAPAVTTRDVEAPRSIAVRTAVRRPVDGRASNLAKLVLSATRGDCWVSVRAGSPTGPNLYEGKLAQGQALRFAKTRLWLRLGAAGNLQATLNGRPLAGFPLGTVDIAITAKGITRVAPT